VQRSSLFNGKPVTDTRFVYTELLPDGLIGVAGETTPPPGERVNVLPRNFANQLLCGVADGAGKCLGLAVVSAIDFSRQSLTLYTPVLRYVIRIVLFGDLYLDQNWQELHLRRLAHF
jgi:polynucleotide 5'-kinase involved in rRNA processing